MTEPPWLTWARKELGVHETPGPESTQRILEYRKLAHIAIDGEDSLVPWCACFINAALEESWFRGTRSAAAKSFERDDDFEKLALPALGCIVTFWRGSPSSGFGHVGFYVGQTTTHIVTLGGNQSDAVSIKAFPKSSLKFGFSGYWWPESARRPEKLGAIPWTGELKEASAI